MRDVLERLEPESAWQKDLPAVAPEHKANEKGHQRQLERWAESAFDETVRAQQYWGGFTFALDDGMEDPSVPTPDRSLHKPDIVDHAAAPFCNGSRNMQCLNVTCVS